MDWRGFIFVPVNALFRKFCGCYWTSHTSISDGTCLDHATMIVAPWEEAMRFSIALVALIVAAATTAEAQETQSADTINARLSQSGV